jgi:hypothetical protein
MFHNFMMDFFTTSHLFASKFIFFTSYEQCWKKMYQIILLNLEISHFDIDYLIYDLILNKCQWVHITMKSK